MKNENKKEFIIDVLYYSIILILTYLGIKYFFGALFPFVLGFIIAFSLRPVIRWINKKTKINNKFISLVVLILFYSLIGLGLFLVIVRSLSLLNSLFEQIPQIYNSDIAPFVEYWAAWVTDLFMKVDPDTLSFIQHYETTLLDSLATFVKNFSTSSISFLTSLITKIPAFFLAFFFSVISSFFITLDYEKITNFLNSQFSGRGQKLFVGVQKNSIAVLWNFFKAYILILLITFAESAIGLSLLGYNNAIGIAIIISIVDILPILGSGTVMIPWAIIEIFNGNVSAGLGLIGLYVAITIIRQVIEPRIVGDQIGLYPLITLMCMYLGTMYFGILGLFGVPIAVTVLVKLQEDGIIKFYNHPSKKASVEDDIIVDVVEVVGIDIVENDNGDEI